MSKDNNYSDKTKMNTSPNRLSKSLTDSIAKSDYTDLNNSTNTEDDFGCVKVEITELDNSSANPTTVSLMRCKKQILHPFRKLLCLIGWRPFGVDSFKRSSICLRILNIIYPLFIFLLLLFNYFYEIIVCQGKLNVATDTKVKPRAPITTTTTTTTTTRLFGENNTILNWTSPLFPTNNHSTDSTPSESAVCGHIFTTYMLPDILHCAAFIIGFVYFRITEGEPMYSLMEKVFIHADRNMRQFSPNRVIRRLKIFLLIGCIWVVASVATHSLSIVIDDFDHKVMFESEDEFQQKSMKYGLFFLDIICLLLSNCIHLAVAMNFVSQCEMVVFYCKSIRTRLEEKSIQLLEAMKQILDLGSCISQLNSAVSRMMSILIVYFLDRTILGILLLIYNEKTDALTYTYRALYPLVWFSILIFCVGQAARVTSKCEKFHRITHSMRVYGYHGTSSSELDGFLLFISAAGLRANLFGLTVRPGKLISIIVTTMIICVVLLQTNIINSPNFSL